MRAPPYGRLTLSPSHFLGVRGIRDRAMLTGKSFAQCRTISLGTGLSCLADRRDAGQAPPSVIRECPSSTGLDSPIGHATGTIPSRPTSPAWKIGAGQPGMTCRYIRACHEGADDPWLTVSDRPSSRHLARTWPVSRLTGCLEGRFTQRVNLHIPRSQASCGSRHLPFVPVVFRLFWHERGTPCLGHALVNLLFTI